MDEVDGIILQSLREIGCNIDNDAKLNGLSPEEVYKSIYELCKNIKPEIDVSVSRHLPAQMAQRFAAASQLVDICKSLGFNGDLGYQTILYQNIGELRRILMWLIEHLPKSEDKTDFSHPTRQLSRSKAVENELAKKLAFDLKRPWVLEFLQPPQNIPVNPVELEKINAADEDTIEYKRRFEPTIFHQTSGNLLVSIIATHDSDLATKGSKTFVQETSSIAQKLRSSAIRSTQSLNLTSSPSRSVISTGTEEIVPQEATAKLKTRFEILTEKIEAMKEKVEDQEDIFRQLSNEKKEQKKSIEDEVIKLDQLKRDKKLKMQVAMLLDNPEESKEKLEQSLEIAMKKRENLNSRFESHKKPLEAHLDSFSGSNALKLQKAEEKISKIKEVKRLIKEIQEDVINKTQSQQQLQIELTQIKRVTERSAYTSRIVDIIKSIKKQNKDIDEILKDTKMLQKAINSLEGQLQRQFTVTEDLIWNNTSKKDEFSKKMYKLLITLHTEFSELIDLIENTGSIQREIREVEDQIENERQQNILQKLERITKDLEMIAGSK